MPFAVKASRMSVRARLNIVLLLWSRFVQQTDGNNENINISIENQLSSYIPHDSAVTELPLPDPSVSFLCCIFLNSFSSITKHCVQPYSLGNCKLHYCHTFNLFFCHCNPHKRGKYCIFFFEFLFFSTYLLQNIKLFIYFRL